MQTKPRLISVILYFLRLGLTGFADRLPWRIICAVVLIAAGAAVGLLLTRIAPRRCSG